jgi:hypothetical protein
MASVSVAANPSLEPRNNRSFVASMVVSDSSKTNAEAFNLTGGRRLLTWVNTTARRRHLEVQACLIYPEGVYSNDGKKQQGLDAETA